ncbi:hypothetical protein INR49_012515 [Caranx melampygus]|nr:hypothetical protein INR49_012515 [Caranx melampygus]
MVGSREIRGTLTCRMCGEEGRGSSVLKQMFAVGGGVTLEVISQLYSAWRSSRGSGLLAIMKGLGTNRNRHLSDSCDPSSGHPEALYPQKTSTLPRSPYLLSPTMDHYGTMDPHLYPSANPGSFAPDCMLPLNNQLSNSSTFPRIHYNSYDQSDFSPPGDSIGGISTGTMGTSMSMGMGTSIGMAGLSGRTPMITSGSATISHHMTKNQAPASLLEFDKQLPGGHDGFSTLQYHRTSAVAAAKQRTDSPGRIRYMLHSVQKLFAKSQSLESHNMKGNVNGRSTGSGGGSSGTEDGGKQNRRSKAKIGVQNQKRLPRDGHAPTCQVTGAQTIWTAVT